MLQGAHSIVFSVEFMADSQLQGVYVALRCRECMPIMFRREENFVGNCMEFVRSMPVTDNFGNVQSESFKLSKLGKKSSQKP